MHFWIIGNTFIEKNTDNIKCTITAFKVNSIAET